MRYAISLCSLLLSLPALAQFEDVTIKSTHVGGSIHMLEGRGGNLGLSVGEDGVFLVDDQYAPLTDRILAAIRALSDAPVRFVINTHWHSDHTGGNEQLGAGGSVVVAHDNVRERMSTDQFMAAFKREVPASPEAALPLVTFNDRITFHFNGEAIRVYHVAAAHTDGDSIIHFPESNVIHMGDNFFSQTYPFIDRSSGGSVQGMIGAVTLGLGLCDSKTMVIPGHGQLSNCAELEDYGEMLSDVSDAVQALIDQGKSLQEVIDARPTADFDEKRGEGWIKPDKFTEFIYNSLR
jgi:glyoxylase-like metal-dependent hydrolase (beta-lactamase superfamily II)